MLTHTHSSPVTPKRVVVIGSSGFVGKHLINYLNEHKISNLPISRAECDLLSADATQCLAGMLQPDDQVIMLAALTPDRGRGMDTFIQNMKIIQNVGEAVKQSPVAQFVLVSSEAIYANTDEIIQEKSSIPPGDLYGCMHLARELYCQSLNIPLVVARLGLVYGNGDTHNSYGPNRFLKEAKAKQTITLFGKGEEKRSHVYVEDVVKCLALIVEHQSLGEVNICNEKSISFMDVAIIIQQSSPQDIQIITQERSGPITHRSFNSTAFYKAFPGFCFSKMDENLKF